MTIRLPIEILTAIIEEVDDPQDLWHIRTANRALCAVATPLAFRVLSAIPTRRSAKNIRRLFDSPDIAAHVREVSFYDTDIYGREGSPMYDSIRPKTIHKLADSFSLVHKLPRLETINLTFFPVDDVHGSRLALQVSILDALAASFSVRAPSNLTSLSLSHLRISDHVPLESPSFQTFLTTLRRLELTVFIDRFLEPEMFPDSWRYLWTTMFPRMVPTPTHNSLTEFTLRGGTHVGASTGLSLATLHFPRLCALFLEGLVFEPSVAVEPFILRHAATLSRLSLVACALLIDTDTDTDTDLSLSGREESSPKLPCWELIWDRFTAELTALVALYVDCDYLSHDHEVSFYDTDHEKSEADVAALLRFRTTVAARSET
ncbi:hypothetical protein EDB83DRAFT_2438664 [Lactarius deliciosus]|nr:hypothetical protein EDB83DRAFT_2438664 [Lactarius deliciosus]